MFFVLTSFNKNTTRGRSLIGYARGFQSMGHGQTLVALALSLGRGPVCDPQNLNK